MRTTNVNSVSFERDNFFARRAAQTGAGVAYDMESLLTGEEIAQGLGYGDKRVVHHGNVSTAVRAGLLPTHFLAMGAAKIEQAIARGEVTPDVVAVIAPRVKAVAA